jgi:beta-RFAP synthase
MSRAVTVTTGARLHFGLIVAPGHQFGSVGLMIDQPGFVVRIEPLGKPSPDRISATPQTAQRVAEFLAQYRSARPAAPVAVSLTREIPAHTGLGSGTQLALSLAAGLSRLFDAPPATAEDLAWLMGRGKRSIVGRVGFTRGGCIFAPPATAETPSSGAADLVVLPTPADWRFLLITPPGQTGLFGRDEQRAFQQMAPMSAELRDRLLRWMREEGQPALARADFPAFSAALYAFGRAVGEHFAPHQGGPFAHRQMAALVDHLREQGVHGVAQTSWGPTLTVLCPHAAAARELADRIAADPRWCDCRCLCAAPRNEGARIVLETD